MTSVLETGDDLGSIFVGDSIPDDEPFIVTSDDPTCEVCGTPLDYSGRGRKPKYCAVHKKSAPKTTASSGRRSATREVDTALASLDQLNGILVTGLFLLSPSAAQHFSANGPALEARNKTILEANPDLARKIATATGKTGPLGLIISYGIVLVPAFGIVRAERQVEYDDEHGS